MSGENTGSPIDVAAITKTVTDAVVTQLTKTLPGTIAEQVGQQFAGKLSELEANLNTVANTVKNVPPADAEGLKKLVAEAIAADRTSLADADAKKAARESLIAKIKAEKLGGKDQLAALLTGDDEASLNASADKILEGAKALLPDFGSTRTDGGNPPAPAGGAGGGLKWAV